jgi:hypothetical protein
MTRYSTLLFGALILLVCLAGCFTSIDPIFDESQILQDPRIEGSYTNFTADGQEMKAKWVISSSHDFLGRYNVRIVDGTANIWMVGTLFKAGEELFLDLYKVRDSGSRHEVAGAPTETEMLQGALTEPRHLIWKINIDASAIDYFVPTRNGVGIALGKVPDLRSNARPSGELVVVLLPRDKKKAIDLLIEFSKDPKIFDYHGKLKRNKS